jgi:CheY-like chemotaxis protein
MSHFNDNTVLVVDGHLPSMIYLCELLEPLDVNVLTANNGKSTLEIVKKNHVDLVLLDLRLSDMDGYEVIKEIKKFDQQIVIIVQTGYFHEKLRPGYNGSCFDDFLAKPISVSKFYSVLDKYLYCNHEVS